MNEAAFGVLQGEAMSAQPSIGPARGSAVDLV